MNYYNENDPKAAAWLRELILWGHIPDGYVDERSIEDVKPNDLSNYRQCHFFSGIGGWPYALRLSGWPEDHEVWTGSCPCQPFSCAGKGAGEFDERHLWPAFGKLIAECKPSVVFGEQVASKAGREWLSGIRTDLEAMGYAVGAADLCAAGAGAPHIRQRLYWVADSGHERTGWGTRSREAESGRAFSESSGRGESGRVADSGHDGRRTDEPGRETQGRVTDGRIGGLGNTQSQRRGEARPSGGRSEERACDSGQSNGLANGIGAGLEGREINSSRREQPPAERSGEDFWNSFDVIPCADGKARRVESGTFPLAHGVSNRVVKLRGLGNAIVPQVAAEFIQAFQECR